MSPRPHANVSRREASLSAPERGREPPGRAAHSGREARHDNRLATIRAAVGAAGAGVYLGAGSVGPAWAGTEQAVLVLGPPRSGKTSSIVVPTVLGAPGAVVSTSTKPDVLQATAHARRTVGPCLLYDPSGTVEAPRGVERVRWSPVESCRSWDDALLVARSLVGAARPGAGARDGAAVGADHWTERAEALLAPTLHAAALDDVDLATVLSWVDRRNAAPALTILDRNGATRPGDLLAGIAATDPREQSGIWSTASGVLGAYRSEAALDSTVAPDFDARAFCDSSATLYVCATGRHQAVAAPLVVGLLTDIRTAAYARSTDPAGAGTEPGARTAPVVLALDEVANIAPIPDLPGMVSEGGGQGLLTLACLQDLSQARGRWGSAADGFLSLFGTTVVLPGIGDVRTLEALSSLAGEQEVLTRSVSAPARRPGGVGAVLSRLALGPRAGPSWQAPTMTTSTVMRRRLPVDVVARGQSGMALVVDERNRMGWVRLTPWFATEPWRSAALDPGLGTGLDPGRRDGPRPLVPTPGMGRDVGPGGL
ncbi:MAG TPA: type IV secretory system conjugative DNA transfer family protein [Acidimicrobiales bacterium]|nr:type IV secretory system conjugative DNA transfer family protein [Acidimicrobiales bacterium]